MYIPHAQDALKPSDYQLHKKLLCLLLVVTLLMNELVSCKQVIISVAVFPFCISVTCVVNVQGN